jgi:hypothetical protein
MFVGSMNDETKDKQREYQWNINGNKNHILIYIIFYSSPWE